VRQIWKARHILVGMLTRVPILNAWRQRHASTGGSDSARYCYSVWFRHLMLLDRCGFKISGAKIGELGPGDSLGIGLAALLSGAGRYVGLDIVPYSAKADLNKILDELLRMYMKEEQVPDDKEFPSVRPRIDSYEFPRHIVDQRNVTAKAEEIRNQLKSGLNSGSLLEYRVPWISLPKIDKASLDLIFSQAVLEHVDSLEETYRAMFSWLKPGGYASHVIDFRAHGRSPFWNGHWAYSDWQWNLVRGKREFLLNREPLSTHLILAKKVGFELLLTKREQASHGLEAPRFRKMDATDALTSSVFLILRKPKPVQTLGY
jgi:SAM-dependent methyltransferase